MKNIEKTTKKPIIKVLRPRISPEHVVAPPTVGLRPEDPTIHDDIGAAPAAVLYRPRK